MPRLDLTDCSDDETRAFIARTAAIRAEADASSLSRLTDPISDEAVAEMDNCGEALRHAQLDQGLRVAVLEKRLEVERRRVDLLTAQLTQTRRAVNAMRDEMAERDQDGESWKSGRTDDQDDD